MPTCAYQGAYRTVRTLNSLLPPVLLRAIRAYGTALARARLTALILIFFVRLRPVASLTGGGTLNVH
jgi:hypothetical protein